MGSRHDIILDRILADNAGIITSAQAQAAGVNRPAFSDYTKRHGLERASRGVYVDPETLPDEMSLLQKHFPKAVFSHDSALFLHELTDREPMPLSVTVGSGYNATALKDQGVRVHFVKPDWYGFGIIDVESPGGTSVRAYDKERTICDIIRRRATMDPSVFRQAIQGYARAQDKDLARLSAYSQVMDMESRVRGIMEVVL